MKLKPRDSKDGMKFSSKLPSFKELVKKKRGQVPELTGRARVEVAWDLSEKAHREQVFLLRVTPKGGETIDLHIPRQALEHYLRAV